MQFAERLQSAPTLVGCTGIFFDVSECLGSGFVLCIVLLLNWFHVQVCDHLTQVISR